jgi:DNA-binding NarL/FixJ family response regulator
MRHGILVVSRSPGLFPLAKLCLSRLKRGNVWGTVLDGDALAALINREKPFLIMMEASFYKYATPYMIGKLLEDMPYLRIAVFSLGEYPDYLEPCFLLNGAKGYITLRDGAAEFRRGLRALLGGSAYIAGTVQKRLAGMKEDTGARPKRSRREQEVMVMLSEGATGEEICETLKISMSTVNHHKGHLFARYHAKNTVQLVRMALSLGKLKAGDFMEVVHGDTGDRVKSEE